MHGTNWTWRLRIPAAVAACLGALFVGTVLAGDSRENDVWLISTRQAPSSVPAGDEDPLRYWRLSVDHRWARADVETLLATDDPGVPTCVFIHGNRTGRQQAVRDGWVPYRHLAKESRRPFRFVIWSWPADRIRGCARRDARVKACRSDVESYYLAQWLNRLDPEVPLCLVGYSFGARVITGALHLWAGGQLVGRTLPDGRAARARAPVRAVLVAAAVDNDSLLPGRRNELALGKVDRLLVTQNPCDPVLKWYRLMHRARGAGALGYTGPAAANCLGPEREKIELLGLGCSVGRDHHWSAYVNALDLRCQLAQYASFTPPEPDSGPGSPVLSDEAASSPKESAGGN